MPAYAAWTGKTLPVSPRSSLLESQNDVNRQNSADRARVLGAAIRTRRHLLKLSQREVADLAQCSERAVRDLERGTGAARFDTVMAVLGALGLGLEVVNSSGEVSVSGDI